MTVSDALIARRAQIDYLADAERLERKAAALPSTMVLTARIVRHWAVIARRAARAEVES